jgi:HTH-type transcriptional regulator/antitoxin MqsA
MSSHRTCPICGGSSKLVIEAREIKVGRWSATVDDEFMRCEKCGEETYLAGQMKATQERAARVIREREKILSPERVRAIRERYGLTQSQLERLLRVGPKTVVRWERGSVMPSAAINTLLKVLDNMPVVVADLAVENGVLLGASLPPSTIVVQVFPTTSLTYSMWRSPPTLPPPRPTEQPGVELPAAVASRLRGRSIDIRQIKNSEEILT